jgi:hypothetical protein
MNGHCCERMQYELASKCQEHVDRYSCPDALIAVVRGGYGLIIHDGTSTTLL